MHVILDLIVSYAELWLCFVKMALHSAHVNFLNRQSIILDAHAASSLQVGTLCHGFNVLSLGDNCFKSLYPGVKVVHIITSVQESCLKAPLNMCLVLTTSEPR